MHKHITDYNYIEGVGLVIYFDDEDHTFINMQDIKKLFKMVIDLEINEEELPYHNEEE